MLNSMTNKFHGASAAQKSEKEFLYVYLFFFCAFSIVFETHNQNGNLGLSTFITLAVALQLLAYSLLALKVLKQQSVRGVSGKALVCHAVVYCARLSSTTWLRGYIPTDATGGWLYQLCDAMSLTMVVILVYHVFRRYRNTYQADQDSFEIGYLLGFCFMLAVLLHPHLNSRPFFDTLWTFALYVDTLAMMPQLWMIAKLELGSTVEALNAHYIAAIAASRAVGLYFWTYGFREFSPKDGSFNFTGWAIMAAHIVQMLLLLDFVYYYAKNWMYASCLQALNQDTGKKVDTISLDDVPCELESAPCTNELESAPCTSELESAPCTSEHRR